MLNFSFSMEIEIKSKEPVYCWTKLQQTLLVNCFFFDETLKRISESSSCLSVRVPVCRLNELRSGF
jgi:hypothetical protein